MMYDHEDFVWQLFGTDWETALEEAGTEERWVAMGEDKADELLEKYDLPKNPRRSKEKKLKEEREREGKGKKEGREKQEKGGKGKGQEESESGEAGESKRRKLTQEGKNEKWQQPKHCIRMVTDSLAVQEVLCGHAKLKNLTLAPMARRCVNRVVRWRRLGRTAAMSGGAIPTVSDGQSQCE